MFIITHALIGALIGIKLQGHIFLAFIFAFLSHFILDTIPHGDEILFNLNQGNKKDKQKLFSIIVTDCFLTLLFLIFMTYYKHPEIPISIVFGIMGSVLPDALWGMHEHWGFKVLSKYHDFHLFFHRIIKKDISFKKGLAVQILFLVIFLKWIL